MSSLARFLQPLPAARRAYSSFFSSKPGGGRYFNSARPTKTVVAGSVAKKSNRGTRGAVESGSSAGEDTSTTRTVSSSSGDGSSPTSPTGPREEPSRPFSLYESSHPHPMIESRDFKLHQFFSLHRPLLLLSDPASILQTAPRMGPLHPNEGVAAANGSEGRSPGAESMEAVADADADAARQLTRALTLSQAGSAVAWENTLKRLGLDVNAQPDRIGSQQEIRKVWRDIVMDSVKRKRRKKMKKHK
ncbi:uncharacterized protein EV420DRAFT_1264536 [Desarmillaria tabescens]|uniref:Mitochondrial mRNA-processing protein COX24 C-terminal domain-containing protein n=1 Tax=Armillaria tabescens TaxID=1929756 RepID=A0AA39NEB1_ARMTA|nr:uncharacterized protein EV420DRAFT_1264536 [Desarmillaria tabescens]KAK0463898.1 hypothetical protein EV420DRAFT_1264536 [Desarmillaria tabescens]